MPEIEEPFFCWWRKGETVYNSNNPYIVVGVSTKEYGLDPLSAEAEQRSDVVALEIVNPTGSRMGEHALSLFTSRPKSS